MKSSPYLVSGVLGCMLVCLPMDVSANNRHFVYTYETATLPAGEIEFEPWTTVKTLRDDYYLRLDHRFEFEFGITDTLQSALYFNVSAYAKEVPDEDGNASLEKAWKMPGISWETKWKLSDPAADAIGSALYFEVSGKPHEAEVEFKVLLDKHWGEFFLAVNFVVEAEWELGDGGEDLETELKGAFEIDLGIGYMISPAWSVGLEIRSDTAMPEFEEVTSSILYAGPTVSYATERWWLSLGIQPQVYAIKGASEDSILDTVGHDGLETRLLLGIHL